ncbi:MAG TPA: alpha-(1-_3)-arabinofuranosyltransferase family protein [Actinomycetes bacterium]|nr:alpha-(1->3)-arabinofuranosyltransferase family protein [Actinomycetes bacterium]
MSVPQGVRVRAPASPTSPTSPVSPVSPRAVAIALWCLLALLVFANSPGVFNPDIKPEVYLAPVRSLGAYLSAWQSTPELGFPSFNVGLAPVTAVVAVIQAFGADADVSARLLRLLLLTLAAWGAARLARGLVGSPSSPWVPLAAAVVYVANPYVVVAGGTLAILWPYALLPWLVAALCRAVGSRGGWRYPAVAALLFAAMTGMNAGVVPLIQLVVIPPFLVLARHRTRCSWTHVGAVLLRWGLLSLLLSLYWLVPTAYALRAGQTVVGNSESVTGIASVSSWAEVLRGLGLWPLYGGDAGGPWLPGQVGYLTNVAVVLLSFGWVLLIGVALVVARGAVRLAALAALVLTAAVMVGLYPTPLGSPFATLLAAGFEHVPGLSAFRTTNKAGAGLVLAVSVLVAAAVHRLLAPPGLVSPQRRRRAAVLGAGAAVVLIGAVGPWWTGGMYTSPMPVPDYWRQAAADLDSGPADQRVWFLPGQVSSDYRWSRERPDDIGNSLFTRPTLVRYVIPVTGTEAANLLQAVDEGVQEGSLPAGALSVVAARLGVGDVLVRNDVVWEQTAGARPATVQSVVSADPGLRPVRNYGAPGENTLSPTVAPADPFESLLPPLQRYAVTGAGDPVHTESAAPTVVVMGDGFAVPPALTSGLITSGDAFRYAGDLDAAAFRQVLAGGARIVLTDSNRRRTTVAGRLTDGLGPLLRADEDPGPTRALFGAADQTTLRTPGVRVDATSSGSVFGTLPQAAPVNAVDGDPSTAWWFGDFGTAVGQALTVSTDRSWTYGRLTLRTVAAGDYRITRLRVSAGSRTVEVPVSPDGRAVADLRGAAGRSLRVSVGTATGPAQTMVGIAEISGLPYAVRPAAALPLTVQRLAATLPAAGRADLARTPVDVQLTRVTGVAATASDDEETALDRDFSLPLARSYDVSGTVEPGATLPEPELDRLAGATGAITAVSSSRAFDLPTVRASMAVDDSRGTGWAPAVPLGAWLRVTGPDRVVRSVTVTQPPEQWQGGWATRIEVSVDGRAVGGGAVGPGMHTIAVTPTRGRSVELRITAVSGSGTVRILDTDAAGGRIRFDPARAADACATVATLDGRGLAVHLLGPITSSAAVPFGPCRSAAVPLAAGAHQLRALPDWTLDSVTMRDTLDRAAPSATPPTAQVASGRTTATVQVGASATPYYLVLGQSYDPRWHASLDGTGLGRPVVVDGWSTGWLVPAGGPHRIVVSYGPQRGADLALAASALGLMLCVGLAVRGRREALPPDRHRQPPPADPRRAEILRWALIVLAAGFLGGLVALAVALALLAWHLVRPPRARTVLGLGLAAWALLGVAFVAGNHARWGQVSPDLVARNPWPNLLALVGLVLLSVGVVRPSRRRRSGTLPGRGSAAGPAPGERHRADEERGADPRGVPALGRGPGP